ncbi:hypothetical protein CDD81_3542 [Ophiocordyceps australis]|uniref:Phenylalanine ammonia-lyase n=1 Tax=Ophiocordyceps australis TaxID=1399860 RepID=A0A2C5XWA9_9HYPO|nr:hypothetical protein CDD81_3542 [Ophiocordyceps australis]
MAHVATLQSYWQLVDKEPTAAGVLLDGTSLTIAQVVAIARRNARASISKSPSVVKKVEQSITTLQSFLDKGHIIYGVNTGFGGNADTRTRSVAKLQSASLQHQQSGILPETCAGGEGQGTFSLSQETTRATIAIRCNSLLRGHSAVRIQVLETLVEAMSRGATPLVPSRGSISASGDLGPLSYIGGFLEANADIFVSMQRAAGPSRIMSAPEALKHLGLEAVTLQPKEGLAIMNGTAASSALAALVMYDAHKLAVLCQLLTAMTTEALLGDIANYHDFLSQVRPHPGQMEAARNISLYLSGSRLCRDQDEGRRGLAQDRYALRTAPQWIGPQLEDLLSANAQIETELNSTTDNPLVDSCNARIHHGGNFQAASVTSAMEKTRSALVMLGRLLLSQSAELNNPDLNNGLSPNLCADDPSLSFTCKGIDINMTAYYSELAFLANSVASHVHSAELNNQSVNSLALISGRMTEKAVEILSIMVAAVLFLLCQALDLRARDQDFLRLARRSAQAEFESAFAALFPDSATMSESFELMWTHLSQSWSKTSRMDLSHRCSKVATDTTASLLDNGKLLSPNHHLSLHAMQRWRSQLDSTLLSTYKSNEAQFRISPSTLHYLASSSAKIYSFVRQDLAIPFHLGLEHHPPLAPSDEAATQCKTVGTYLTRLYIATRDDSLIRQVMDWHRLRDANGIHAHS